MDKVEMIIIVGKDGNATAVQEKAIDGKLLVTSHNRQSRESY
jgi:hypothetical protein